MYSSIDGEYPYEGIMRECENSLKLFDSGVSFCVFYQLLESALVMLTEAKNEQEFEYAKREVALYDPIIKAIVSYYASHCSDAMWVGEAEKTKLLEDKFYPFKFSLSAFDEIEVFIR